MSITFTFFRLPAAEQERLTRDQNTWQDFYLRSQRAQLEALQSAIAAIPEGLSQADRMSKLGALLSQGRDPRRFDLEKDWQTLGYLLTGQAEVKDQHCEDEPLHNVIYGGINLAISTGYGPGRYYDERMVAEISGALRSFDRALAAHRFDPDRMGEPDIYAAPDAQEKEGILRLVDEFAAFFAAAAAAQEQVVRFIA